MSKGSSGVASEAWEERNLPRAFEREEVAGEFATSQSLLPFA